jgi:hypothetical protein
LGDSIKTAMPATELTGIAVDDAGALVKKAKERNQVAFAQLTMVFTTEADMTFIYEGMTDTDWPSGLAYLGGKALKKKYTPEDTISKVELRRMMNNIKMKKNDDPVELFNQILAVKVRYERPGNAIDENEFIAIVISVAPRTYQGVLTSEQTRQGKSLRLSHLAVVMDMQWRAVGGAKDNKEEGEIALITLSGMCYNCNQSGHRAFECPQKKKQGSKCGGNGSNGGNHNNNNNNNHKKTIVCSICNKKGHGDINCWMKPGNKDRKPQ